MNARDHLTFVHLEDAQRPSRTPRRFASRGRLRVGGVMAACVALAAVACATGPEGNVRLSALDAAAAAAGSRPSVPAAAGSYAYLRVRRGGRANPRPLGLAAAPSRASIEFWIGADESGRIAETMSADGGDVPVGGGWRRAGTTWTRALRFGPGRFSAIYRGVVPGVLDLPLDQLPTDPGALAARLRHELAKAVGDADPETGFAGDSRFSPGEMLIAIGQILAHPLAPPALRSALYEVAGTLEGVDVDEHAADPAGRPAAVIRLDEATNYGTQDRYELFFDPNTSATLATRFAGREELTDDGADPGARRVHLTFTEFTVYVRRGRVDSIRARP